MMRGGMAAVSLGRDKVQPYLPPGVRIACENSGQNVTVSGDVKPLKKVMSQIKTDFPDTFIRKLLVKMTYYSRECCLRRWFVSFNQNQQIRWNRSERNITN